MAWLVCSNSLTCFLSLAQPVAACFSHVATVRPTFAFGILPTLLDALDDYGVDVDEGWKAPVGNVDGLDEDATVVRPSARAGVVGVASSSLVGSGDSVLLPPVMSTQDGTSFGSFGGPGIQDNPGTI